MQGVFLCGSADHIFVSVSVLPFPHSIHLGRWDIVWSVSVGLKQRIQHLT